MNELKVIHIINKYDSLREGLKYIIENNTANNAPYHNLNHMLTVTRHVYQAFEFMGLGNDERLEPSLLAALFHDFNHSMGKENDAINVSYAKNGLEDFLRTGRVNLDIDFMFSILDATQYPYIILGDELDTYQKIIRDCDVCQVFEYDWLKQIILGLSIEMKYSFVDLVKGQRNFLLGVEYLTSYGKEMRKLHFDDILDEMDILESIIS